MAMFSARHFCELRNLSLLISYRNANWLRIYDGADFASVACHLLKVARPFSGTVGAGQNVIFERELSLKSFGHLDIKAKCMRLHLKPLESGDLCKLSILGRHQASNEKCIVNFHSLMNGHDDIGNVDHDIASTCVADIKYHLDDNYGRGVTLICNGADNNSGIDEHADGQHELGAPAPYVVQLQIPHQLDLTVTTSGVGDHVTIDDLELSHVECSLVSGNLSSHNLKCSAVQIASGTGDVDFKGYVQGNVDVELRGNGNLSGTRIQGSNVRIIGENGKICVETLYADTCEIIMANGSVRLGNFHGNSKLVLQQGDLIIGSMDGTLDAHVLQGDANVHISRIPAESRAFISSDEGSIQLSISELLKSHINCKGKQLKIQDTIEGVKSTGSHGGHSFEAKCDLEDGPTIVASAPNGTVSAEVRDWFQSVRKNTK